MSEHGSSPWRIPQSALDAYLADALRGKDAPTE
jgi:hypothetical protein